MLEGFKNISECCVGGVTTERENYREGQGGRPQDSLFLDGLIQFIVRAKAQGTEELFSFHKANGDRVVLTGSSEGGGEEHMRALRTGP